MVHLRRLAELFGYRLLTYSLFIKVILLSYFGQAQDIQSVFQYGRRMGLATVRQEAMLNASMRSWTMEQQGYVRRQIGQGRSILAQFMLLESLLAWDQEAVLQRFASQINQLTDAQLLERCTVRASRRSLIQQWQNTCSITVVETFLADLCPRYAFELRADPDFNTVATNQPDGIAQQQQQLMEHYGGRCSLRGYGGGVDIGLIDPLNDYVGKILAVRFETQAVSGNADGACRAIREQLAAGICVPIRVTILPAAGHFMLVLDSRNTPQGMAYLIYDPFDGVTGYVLEATLKQGSLAPLNTTWQVQLTHYYTTQSR